ncbi:MAG: hypothetical protein ABR987_09145 [Terracidiphilus sp.]
MAAMPGPMCSAGTEARIASGGVANACSLVSLTVTKFSSWRHSLDEDTTRPTPRALLTQAPNAVEERDGPAWALACSIPVVTTSAIVNSRNTIQQIFIDSTLNVITAEDPFIEPRGEFRNRLMPRLGKGSSSIANAGAVI